MRTKLQFLAVCRGMFSGGRGHTRAFSLLVAALITLCTVTIAWGQASGNFDLACRSVIYGGGGTSTGGSFGLLATLGQFVSPQAETSPFPTYTVRSANFGLRAGFLPGYPTLDSSTLTTTLATTFATMPDQAQVQRLPLVTKVVRIVRGGC